MAWFGVAPSGPRANPSLCPAEGGPANVEASSYALPTACPLARDSAMLSPDPPPPGPMILLKLVPPGTTGDKLPWLTGFSRPHARSCIKNTGAKASDYADNHPHLRHFDGLDLTVGSKYVRTVLDGYRMHPT